MTNDDQWINETVLKPAGWRSDDYIKAKATIKAKMLEARLDEIRLSNLTSAIDSVRAKYMQNRVAELQALSTKEADHE